MFYFVRKVLLLGAFILMLTGCDGRIRKDKPEEVQPERFSEPANPQPLCGGYTDQREPSEEEIEMFRSVTGSLDVAYTPLSVSTQVVAGMNYKFYCRFEETSDCWITIFKPLPGQGEPTISSIEKVQ